jgi:hypothetical protein
MPLPLNRPFAFRVLDTIDNLDRTENRTGCQIAGVRVSRLRPVRLEMPPESEAGHENAYATADSLRRCQDAESRMPRAVERKAPYAHSIATDATSPLPVERTESRFRARVEIAPLLSE